MTLPFDHILDFLKWLFGRPRLGVRILSDDADRENGELRFEVENRSSTLTSLTPHIECTYYYLSAMRIKRDRNCYFVRQADRRLEPFKPEIMAATPEEVRDHYGFSWFRTYKFRPTRGLAKRVRIRNALLEPLALPLFVFELARFRMFGKVKPDSHSSLESLGRLRRRQGPH